MTIAMIPSRMGSQRLKRKNLRKFGGVPLINSAIRKCKEADVFDEIWVNSEHLIFKEIAIAEGVRFHQRPEVLGNNQATSEQYIAEFLEHHLCDYIVQVHSIAPLITIEEIINFVAAIKKGDVDCLLSTEDIQLECVYKDNPVNFTFTEKTNSQELIPVKKISWSIAGWNSEKFLEEFHSGKCATYAGRIGFFPISKFANIVIKTEEDLRIAEALLPLF